MCFEEDDLDIIATSLLMTIKSAEKCKALGIVLDPETNRIVDRVREILKKIEG